MPRPYGPSRIPDTGSSPNIIHPKHVFEIAICYLKGMFCISFRSRRWGRRHFSTTRVSSDLFRSRRSFISSLFGRLRSRSEVISSIKILYVPPVHRPTRMPDLILASIYHRCSIGPSIQSIGTGWCCQMTNVIQVCRNFSLSPSTLTYTRPDETQVRH